MIYIDPPYNTGSGDFVYNDDRRYTQKDLIEQGLDEQSARRVLDFATKGSRSHSAWLTFMYPRLALARELLRDDGVIFISIDDNECAQLKLLCDSVFGEGNFVSWISWRQFHSVKNDAKNFSKNTEYVLCYAKAKTDNIINNEAFDKTKSYRLNDNDGRGFYKLDPVWAKSGTNAEKYLFKNQRQWSPPSGTFWRYSFDRLREMEKNNEIVFDGKNPMAKRFLSQVSVGRKSSTFWDGKEVGFTLNGDSEVKEIFNNNKIFTNPKPIGLLKRILEIATTSPRNVDSEGTNPKAEGGIESEGVDSVDCHARGDSKILDEKCGLQENEQGSYLEGNDRRSFSPLPHFSLKAESSEPEIILDFFAGSGTTAHAVLELNQADHANRQFILVQLDEKLDPKANKAAYDFCKNELNSLEPSIYDITKERVIRAAQKLGIKADNLLSEYELVAKRQEELEKLEVLDEKLDYESFQNIYVDSLFVRDDTRLNEILTSYKLLDGFMLDRGFEGVDLAGYRGHTLEGFLYLIESGFEKQCLKELLQKLEGELVAISNVVIYTPNFQSAEFLSLRDGLRGFRARKISFLPRV